MEDADTLLSSGQRHPVDLNLEWVLGKMPRKVCLILLYKHTRFGFFCVIYYSPH